MKIGFTFDLRKDYLNRGFTEEETAEFDSEETIKYVADAIAGLGHEVVRIGSIYQLIPRLLKGETWDLVLISRKAFTAEAGNRRSPRFWMPTTSHTRSATP